MNAIGRFLASLKQLTMRWAARPSWGGLGLGATRVDWSREVGDGRGNAIVAACVKWVCRTFPEAPLQVLARGADGELRPQEDHSLAQLLDRPNPHYSGVHLWSATLADWMITGNAYWLKVRSGAGRVVELWWSPSFMLEPKWPDNGTEFISHYEYTLDGQPYRIETADVVHFRNGFDPNNIRKGLSDLAALYREIATDNEGANWSASLLRNMGVPGVVIAPSDDSELQQEDADQVKTQFAQRFGGDRRGEPLVMSARVTVSTLSFSPEQMVMRDLRRIPEERISAVFGTPAVVVGLGAGLDRSTFANMAEAREAAYESTIIPTQRLMAAELQTQLVPDFGDPTRIRIAFDLSNVRVLQADQNDLYDRLGLAVERGWLTINDARLEAGYDPIPGGDEVRVLPAPGTAAPPRIGLPAPKRLHVVTNKAIEEIPDELESLYLSLVPGLTDDMVAFLESQAGRVAGRLTTESTPDSLLPETEMRRLRRVLEPAYRAAMLGVHGIVAAELGVAFDLEDALVSELLRLGGQRITGIHETTRNAIVQALINGANDGEGIPQLARRIRELTEFGRPRAETIARTELGTAQIDAAFLNYQRSGVVVGVRIIDGDYDPECAARNGTVMSMAAASRAPRLLHPNCTAAWAPIVDEEELRGAA